MEFLEQERHVLRQRQLQAWSLLILARTNYDSNTTPIPLRDGEWWRCRYAFGYGLDGSEVPVYFLLPERTDHGSFYLLDCVTSDYFDLRATKSIQTIGLEHFFESFGLQLDRRDPKTPAVLLRLLMTVCLRPLRTLTAAWGPPTDECYTRLQPLGDELHQEQCPDHPTAIKKFFEQGWDFTRRERQLHQFLALPVA